MSQIFIPLKKLSIQDFEFWPKLGGARFSVSRSFARSKKKFRFFFFISRIGGGGREMAQRLVKISLSGFCSIGPHFRPQCVGPIAIFFIENVGLLSMTSPTASILHRRMARFEPGTFWPGRYLWAIGLAKSRHLMWQPQPGAFSLLFVCFKTL